MAVAPSNTITSAVLIQDKHLARTEPALRIKCMHSRQVRSFVYNLAYVVPDLTDVFRFSVIETNFDF